MLFSRGRNHNETHSPSPIVLRCNGVKGLCSHSVPGWEKGRWAFANVCTSKLANQRYILTLSPSTSASFSNMSNPENKQPKTTLWTTLHPFEICKQDVTKSALWHHCHCGASLLLCRNDDDNDVTSVGPYATASQGVCNTIHGRLFIASNPGLGSRLLYFIDGLKYMQS